MQILGTGETKHFYLLRGLTVASIRERLMKLTQNWVWSESHDTVADGCKSALWLRCC